MNERSPAALAIGILYAALGVVLLLVTVDAWRPPLAVVGPLVIVAAGLALVVGGIHLRRPGRQHHDTVIGGAALPGPGPGIARKESQP